MNAVMDRGHEGHARTALGAARGQIARQFLLESVTLGIFGGLAGLGLAFGGVRLLTWLGPENLPRLNEITLDPSRILQDPPGAPTSDFPGTTR